MAETLTLMAPLNGPMTTSYRLVRLNLNIEASSVHLTAISDTGAYITRAVNGADAVALMHTLNTANLSVKSLQRRALEYMAAQGDFAGTVSGTPD